MRAKATIRVLQFVQKRCEACFGLYYIFASQTPGLIWGTMQYPSMGVRGIRGAGGADCLQPIRGLGRVQEQDRKRHADLELGTDEVRPKLAEEVGGVAVEITGPHGDEVIGRGFVWTLLGGHEEAVAFLLDGSEEA